MVKLLFTSVHECKSCRKADCLSVERRPPANVCIYSYDRLTFLLRPRRGAEYCDQPVCLSVCVCLYICSR